MTSATSRVPPAPPPEWVRHREDAERVRIQPARSRLSMARTTMSPAVRQSAAPALQGLLSVVQWIERPPPKRQMWVRFPPEGPLLHTPASAVGPISLGVEGQGVRLGTGVRGILERYWRLQVACGTPGSAPGARRALACVTARVPHSKPETRNAERPGIDSRHLAASLQSDRPPRCSPVHQVRRPGLRRA